MKIKMAAETSTSQGHARQTQTQTEREREREREKLTVHSPAPCTPRMHAVPGVYERERRGGAEGYATQVSSSEEFSFTLHARKQVVVWSNNL